MAEREKIYTRDEAAELALLWEELEEWGEQRRFNRWGRRTLSAKMVHEVAEERGLKISATGKPWVYETALRALQIAGKMPHRTGAQRKRGKKGADAAAPKSPAAAQPKATDAAAPKSAPALMKTSKTAQWLASAAPPKTDPAASAPEPDRNAVFAYFERDLGAFLRPEDRERAQRTSSAANARKIQELAIELAAKTESRARLAVYVGVYDRLIARITHRLEMLRERGADPDDEDRHEEQSRRDEDAELYGVHAEVMPISAVRRRS